MRHAGYAFSGILPIDPLSELCGHTYQNMHTLLHQPCVIFNAVQVKTDSYHFVITVYVFKLNHAHSNSLKEMS